MERCGPTRERMVAIIMVITNCTPSTAIMSTHNNLTRVR